MTAREEATNAIKAGEQMLVHNEPLTPLQRKLALATLEHARESVEAIEVLRRPRRKQVKL